MAAQPPAPERASVSSVPAQGVEPTPATPQAEAAAPPAQQAAPQPEQAVPPAQQAAPQTQPSAPHPAAAKASAVPVGPRPKPGQRAARSKSKASATDRLAALPRRTLLAGAAGMLVVLVALVMFVVLPAFRSHQASSQWSETSVSLPSKVGNLKRLKGTQINALVKTMAANGIPRNGIGVYGTLGKNAVILVAAKPQKALTGDDQLAQREAMERGFTSASKVSGFTLKEQSDAGPLGGYLGCGKATNSSVTICLATDAGSVVGTITGPAIKDPAALTRTARAAAVKRTP